MESIDDDGVDETAVGLVQRIQETARGREFAFVASVLRACCGYGVYCSA